MRWVSEFSRSAEKQLDRLPRREQKRITDAVDELESDPFQGDVRPLQGRHQRRFRKRVGRYRIIFRMHPDDHILEISAIFSRNDRTYR